MLPFGPEPVERLRARYPLALEEPTDLEAIRLGTQSRPGERRRNVFDFADGLRLVVSDDPPAGVHVSASMLPGTALWGELARIIRARGADAAKLELCARAARRFAELAGPGLGLELQGFSADKGVPHFVAVPVAGAHA